MNNTSRKKARAKPKLHGTKQQKETDEFGGEGKRAIIGESRICLHERRGGEGINIFRY